jgi:monothiol glutaredoxin
MNQKRSSDGLRNTGIIHEHKQEKTMSLDETMKNRIQQEITQHPVMLYMKGTPEAPQCGFSAKVVEILQSQGVPFGSKDILADENLRQGIKEFSNWPTIPQLYVNGKFVGGCDIITEMDGNGELKKLLPKS